MIDAARFDTPELKFGELMGRAVELRSVPLPVGLRAQVVLRETNDGFLSALVVLAASAHWKDTGERCFESDAALQDVPMVYTVELSALARMAMEVNGAKPPTVTNGTGAAVTGEPIAAHPT